MSATASSVSATSGVRFGDIQLKTGVRLHYAQAGSGSAEVILFLHGYSDSWFSHSLVQPSLSSSFVTFAPDQRGHGDSSRPEVGYAMANLASDMVAFLDAMGVRRATVVGHSMGSFVAQKLAIDHPDRVKRLVLVDSATTPVNEVMLGLQEYVRTLTDPVPPEFVRDFQLSTAYRPLPEPFLDRVVAESLKLPARVWRSALAGLLATDTKDKLHRIQCPTLILWGDRDAIFAREEQQRLVEVIPGATLRVYLETGHTPHWEQPERFVQDLQTFIQSPVLLRT